MIPMALKEMISSLVNLIDTIMVGQLGETSIAAVGIANQLYFLFTVFLFGISCGAGVLASQFWGAGNEKGLKKVLGINLSLSSLLAVFFIMAALFLPKPIFYLFSQDPAVIGEGMGYIRIVCIGYFATALTTAFDMSVCCSQKAGLPFISRLVGLVVNIFFNWVFIFGNLGVPALGVKGAAVATVIARCSELAVMLIVIYGRKYVQAASLRELLTIPKELIIRYFRAASPVIANEMAWAVGVEIYTLVFAQISPEAIVVMTIVQNIERLLLVFFHGGGNAGGVIIGNAVGARKYHTAYIYAKKLCFLCLMTGLVLSTAFIFARPLILMPYKVSPQVYEQTKQLLIITAVMMNIKSLTFFLIVGAFRNGGDTKTAMFIDIGSVWLVGVPVVFLCGLVFHLPLFVTYAAMCSEEVIKLIVSARRFKSKKWIKNLVAEG